MDEYSAYNAANYIYMRNLWVNDLHGSDYDYQSETTPSTNFTYWLVLNSVLNTDISQRFQKDKQSAMKLYVKASIELSTK